MSDDRFSLAQERIANFNLSVIHTLEEWQTYFDDGILLLEHPDQQKKEYALERMQKGIWCENFQHFKQADFRAAPGEQRLLPILNAILN